MRRFLVALLMGVSFCAVAELAGAKEQPTFGGYFCEKNCLNHAEGYRWAEEFEIKRYSDCYGLTMSFEEGCQAYVDDPYRGGNEDDNGDYIDY